MRSVRCNAKNSILSRNYTVAVLKTPKFGKFLNHDPEFVFWPIQMVKSVFGLLFIFLWHFLLLKTCKDDNIYRLKINQRNFPLYFSITFSEYLSIQQIIFAMWHKTPLLGPQFSSVKNFALPLSFPHGSISAFLHDLTFLTLFFALTIKHNS